MYITEDTGDIYVDISSTTNETDGERIKLANKISGLVETESGEFEERTFDVESIFLLEQLAQDTKQNVDLSLQYIQEALNDKVSIYGDELKGALSLANGKTTTITSEIAYYRPIRVSTEAPTAADGNIGDIWIQYNEV